MRYYDCAWFDWVLFWYYDYPQLIYLVPDLIGYYGTMTAWFDWYYFGTIIRMIWLVTIFNSQAQTSTLSTRTKELELLTLELSCLSLKKSSTTTNTFRVRAGLNWRRCWIWRRDTLKSGSKTGGWSGKSTKLRKQTWADLTARQMATVAPMKVTDYYAWRHHVIVNWNQTM